MKCFLFFPLAAAMMSGSVDGFGFETRSSLHLLNKNAQSTLTAGFALFAATPEVPKGSGEEEGDAPPKEEAGAASEQPKMEQKTTQPPPPPPPPMRSQPPPPRKRLDPMIESLTRMDDATRNAPTTNVPLLGEVPMDGSLIVLAPAAIIAVLGFALSIVIAVQSQDVIVDSIARISQDVATNANTQANQVYDPNECRGLCSSQEQDLENLRKFMSSFGKK